MPGHAAAAFRAVAVDSGVTDLRATRSYTDEPISESDLSAILEAGRWTGSSLNSQPWTFVVVDDPDIKQQLSQAGQFASHVATAPIVIVLVGEPGRGEFDLGRVAQNMMLAADSLGIGSCPATLHDKDSVRDALGIADVRPARHAVAFGHPDHAMEGTVRRNMKLFTGAARKPLDEIVSKNRFDPARTGR